MDTSSSEHGQLPDICGNVATCLQTISVVNPLDPELLGDPFDTICSGDLVVFEAFDQGINPITYDWSFGSGAAPGMQTDRPLFCPVYIQCYKW